MEFKSTENLLKSPERSTQQQNLPKNVKLVRTQTFDVSSSSSTHSNKQGGKIVVENVQVHQPQSSGPMPVPRRSAFKKSQQVLKTAKDNANEIIQMSTFSTSVDEPGEIVAPVSVLDTTKKSHGIELEDFSDISSISSHHGNKSRVKAKTDKNLRKKVETPVKPEDVDQGNFIVHKSGIWGDIPTVATEEPIQKVSEYEKENDESLKEKSSEMKVVNEKPPTKSLKSTQKSDRPRTSKSRQKSKIPTIKSESSQTLYRSSVTTNSSSDGESSVEVPAKHQKKQKKDRSKGSSKSSETSYSSASKSKASKESSDDEPLVEQDEISVRSDQILGVYVHHTTDLKFDIRIRDPRIRVTIVDERTGGLAIYNQQTIKAKQMEQPFILPLTTKQCEFISQM